jgi:hypothetical protein
VIKKNRDPRWEDEFEFVCEEPPVNDKIHVEVLSKAPKKGLIHGKVCMKSWPSIIQESNSAFLLLWYDGNGDSNTYHYDCTFLLLLITSLVVALDLSEIFALK